MSAYPFDPTHVVPDGGMPTWEAPDPQRPHGAQLDAGLTVEVLERRADGWAQIRCANGWSAWVDGRLLSAPVAAPSAPVAAPSAPVEPPTVPVAAATYQLPAQGPPTSPPRWTPTHVVPTGGMPTWDAPDSQRPPGSHLDGGVAVEVLERRADGWAQIRCSNGWSAWADGRLLSLPVGPAGSGEGRPRSAAGAAISWLPNVDPFSAGGAALVLVGSFLPWLSVGPFSASAWDISLNYLLTGHGTLSGFKVGIVLVAVVVVAIPSLSGRPLPGWVVPLVGGVSLCAALAALVRGLGTAPSLDPGVGLFVTLAGGATLVVRAWLQLMAPPPV